MSFDRHMRVAVPLYAFSGLSCDDTGANCLAVMKLGVIGGSSLVTFDPQTAFAVIGLQIAEKSDIIIETTYGNVNMRKFVLTGDGHHTIFFIQRHSHGADGGLTTGITPPHKINHRANIRALADVECDMIVGTSSVGA